MPTNTKKQLPVFILSAFALMLAVGTAGCAKGEDPTVATANSGAPKAGATATTGSGQDSGLKYSQCMRDQGLTWFPDPGADGGLKVSVPEGTQSKYEKAEEACKAYAPWEGQQGHQISAEDRNKLRQVSQCMRDHGFAKYPDPDANGSIKIDSKVLGVEPDDPAFQKAMQECDKYMPPRKSGGNS
jgi:hypothetical protein